MEKHTIQIKMYAHTTFKNRLNLQMISIDVCLIQMVKLLDSIILLILFDVLVAFFLWLYFVFTCSFLFTYSVCCFCVVFFCVCLSFFSFQHELCVNFIPVCIWECICWMCYYRLCNCQCIGNYIEASKSRLTTMNILVDYGASVKSSIGSH